MAELSAYAPPVDSGRIAERVALNYMGEKIDETLSGAKRASQSGTYIPGIGSLSGFVVAGAGASVYRAAPPAPVPPTLPKIAVLRTFSQSESTVLPKTVVSAPAMPDANRLPIALYNEAIASQAKVFRNYEPTGMRLVMENWTPRPKPNTEFRNLWSAIVTKFFEMRVQELAAEDAAQERWIDEGLRHPPLESVQTVRVRLNPVGPLPPRIAYDPDRE